MVDLVGCSSSTSSTSSVVDSVLPLEAFNDEHSGVHGLGCMATTQPRAGQEQSIDSRYQQD